VALVVWAAVSLAALALGTRVLRLIRLWPGRLAEQALFALGLGYVLLAYAVLALGLAQVLYLWTVAIVVGVALLLLWPERTFIAELAAALRALPRRLFRRNWLLPVRLAVLAWAAMTLIGALAPPAGIDWDGLAHHLAVPKIYVRDHGIHFIRFTTHSNFPYTVNMLFVVGLLAKTVAGAKLFHWGFGILSVAALYVLTKRALGAWAGQIAAFLLATTPMTAWLAMVGYVDLGALFYTLLALLAFLAWLGRDDAQAAGGSDLYRCGLAVGGALTVKMQALSLLGLVLALVLWRLMRIPELGWPRRFGAAAGLVGVAVLTSCPWYIKTFVWTGNPVYPFAYSVFGGKYWTEENAELYARHQKEFGVGDLPAEGYFRTLPVWRRLLVGPREPWKWLAAPWNLTMYPWHFATPVQPLAVYLCYSIGPLYLALLAPLVLLAGRPKAINWTLTLGGLMFLVWFALMQYARYALPVVAVLALPAAYSLERLRSLGLVSSIISTFVVAFAAAIALGLALLLTIPQARVVFGLQSQEEFLEQTLDVYRPEQFINKFAEPDATIALLQEPRGFYLDRDYFWADPGHNTIVPYHRIKTPQDLARVFGKQLGVRYVLAGPQFVAAVSVAKNGLAKVFKDAIDLRYLEAVYMAGPRSHVVFAVQPPAEPAGEHRN